MKEEGVKQEKVEKAVIESVNTEGKVENKKGGEEEKKKAGKEEQALLKSGGKKAKQSEIVAKKNEAKKKDEEKEPKAEEEEEEAETNQQPPGKESPKSQATTEQKDKETPPKKAISSFFGKERFALSSAFHSWWFRFIGIWLFFSSPLWFINLPRVVVSRIAPRKAAVKTEKSDSSEGEKKTSVERKSPKEEAKDTKR